MSEPLLLRPVEEYTVISFFVKTKQQVRMAGKNLVLLNLTLISVPCGATILCLHRHKMFNI